MAKVEVKTKIELDVKISFELPLREAMALLEITKYDSKAFLEGYYKQLGKSYLQPYEKAVISLFETLKESLPTELNKANEITKAIHDLKQLEQ